MMPRPPKSPTRTEVPAGSCPVVSATAAASVAPNELGQCAREHARACAAGYMHQPTPSTHHMLR
eukprot:5666888-Pyramimonas_sp.AAC.1